MSDKELLEANIAWLREQIFKIHYGEAGIRVILHDGEIKRLERTVTEKIQSDL